MLLPMTYNAIASVPNSRSGNSNNPDPFTIVTNLLTKNGLTTSEQSGFAKTPHIFNFVNGLAYFTTHIDFTDEGTGLNISSIPSNYKRLANFTFPNAKMNPTSPDYELFKDFNRIEDVTTGLQLSDNSKIVGMVTLVTPNSPANGEYNLSEPEKLFESSNDYKNDYYLILFNPSATNGQMQIMGSIRLNQATKNDVQGWVSVKVSPNKVVFLPVKISIKDEEIRDMPQFGYLRTRNHHVMKVEFDFANQDKIIIQDWDFIHQLIVK